MILDIRGWSALICAVLVGMIIVKVASWYDDNWGDPT